MANIWKNLRSLASNQELRNQYLRYLSAKMLCRPPTVPMPFGGRVTARTFSEFHSIFCLMPTPREVEWVGSQACEADAVYVDIGANVGAWSVMFAKSNPAARVFAFEPSRRTFESLQRSVRLSGVSNVTCENMAISDTVGIVKLQEPQNASVFSRILPTTESSVHAVRFAVSAINEVRAIRLDEYCRDHRVERIHLMKIDVEGAEPLVLGGLGRLLADKRIDQILIEIEPDNLVSMGFSVSELHSQIVTAGYSLYRLGNRLNALLAANELRGGNYLCLPS